MYNRDTDISFRPCQNTSFVGQPEIDFPETRVANLDFSYCWKVSLIVMQPELAH